MYRENEDRGLREFEAQQENSTHRIQEDLSKAMKVREVEGKSYVLGFEVPRELAGGINSALAGIQPYISKIGAPLIGRMAAEGARFFGVKSTAAQQAADRIGQAAFVWTGVFYQQASGLYSQASHHHEERTKLYKDFRPIIEATGANPRHNEVMEVEYSRAGENFMRALKGMAPELLTLAPNAYIAMRQQNAINGAATLSDFTIPLPDGNRFAVTPEKMLGAGAFARTFIEPYSKKGTVDDSPTAWRMIKNVQRAVEDACQRKRDACKFDAPSPDSIRVDGVPLSEYIVDVFQHHEETKGRTPLAGANLEKLQDASRVIAESIAKGEVDPSALVLLVGEHKVITRTADNVIVAKEEAVQDAIKQISTKLGTRISLTAEEFFRNFASRSIVRDDIKKNLDTMPPLEKAAFAALLPDEVLEQAGMKKEAIVAARSEARGHMRGLVESYVRDISDVIDNSSKDQLRDMGLTKRDIRNVKLLLSALDMKSENREEILNSVLDRHQEVLATIATVFLNEQHVDPELAKKSFAERIKAESKKQNKLVDKAETATAEAAKEPEPKASFTSIVNSLREDGGVVPEVPAAHAEASVDEEGAAKFSTREERMDHIVRASQPKDVSPTFP